jgi:hypothetical protein
LKGLKENIEKFCVEKGVRKIICDIIGFDNSYFMIYLKKKPKTFARGSKGSNSVKKDKLESALKFNNTISLGGTMSGFGATHHAKNTIPLDNNSVKPAAGLCQRLYTISDSYENYMCLGCC